MFYAPTSQFKIGNRSNPSWGQVATDAVSVVLTSGLIVYFFLFVTLYVAVAALWVAVLNSNIGGSIRSIQLSKSIDGIGSIFIFIYLYVWLAEAISGYADGPTKLRQLLYDIGLLTNHITIAMSKRELDVAQLMHFRNHVHAMVVSVFILFIGTNEIHHNLGNKKEIDAILVKYKRYKDDNLTICISIALQIQEWVHSLETRNVIRVVQLDVFNSNFDLIMKALRDIDSATKVNKPYIFRGHLVFSLYLYFIFWLPLLVDVSVGDGGMLVLYPILMLILTGPIIYRTWLGDPFDLSNNPTRYNDYFLWFREYTHNVDLFCKST